MGHFSNRSILYLHGYDSSSQGEKPQRLRKYCSDNRLLIPDLPLDPQECMKVCEDTLRTASNDTIIMGASLGGFYAYYLASKFQRDCLLINPVFNPSQEAKKILESEENLDKKKMILNAANMYLAIESNLKSLKKPEHCFIALGSHDTTIDPIVSAEYFSHAHVQSYADGHYMHQNFEEILEDFEDYLEEKF